MKSVKVIATLLLSLSLIVAGLPVVFADAEATAETALLPSTNLQEGETLYSVVASEVGSTNDEIKEYAEKNWGITVPVGTTASPSFVSGQSAIGMGIGTSWLTNQAGTAYIKAVNSTVKNYVFEAVVYPTSGYNIGIAANIELDTDGKIKGATNLLANVGASNPDKLYREGGSGSDTTYQSWTAATAPEGYVSITKNQNNTLRMVAYNDTLYFYINGVFVCSYDDSANTTDTISVGLCSTYGTTYVRSAYIKELNETITLEDGTSVRKGDTLYDVDFTEMSSDTDRLAEGNNNWGVGVPGDAWCGAMPTMSAANSRLNISSGSAHGIIYINPLKSSKQGYVFEATAYPPTTSLAYLGVATNIEFDDSGAMIGATYMAANKNSTTLPLECKREDIAGDTTYASWSKDDGTAKELEAPAGYVAPSNGSEYKFKLVAFEGILYFYFNDVLMYTVDDSANTTEDICVGIFSRQGSTRITSATVYEIGETVVKADPTAPMTLGEASVGYNDILGNTVVGSNGIRFSTTIDTADELYTANADTAVFGLIVKISDTADNADITADDLNILKTTFTGDSYTLELTGLSTAAKDKFYCVRGYMLVGEKYYYSEMSVFCPTYVANDAYAASDDETVKAALEAVYGPSDKFVTNLGEGISFTLFADFHYREGVYMSSVADMETILARADANNSDFIFSLGDMYNDVAGSPEISNLYANYTTTEGSKLASYNIYGNHELEAKNTMKYVTTTLVNNDDTVVWGTEDGIIAADGSIGYYYFEKNGIRVICLDSNYSYNPSTEQYEHYPTNSYGAPSGHEKGGSLGPDQLSWLEDTLMDAVTKGISCIVMAHDSMSSSFGSCPDRAEVRSIYAKANAIRTGSVIASFNGHYHTNRQVVEDDVLYLDINTVRNGLWKSSDTHHYTDETFTYITYDEEGNAVSTDENYLITNLGQSISTWFFTDPLSCNVSIDPLGTVTVEGMTSTWLSDIDPNNTAHVAPEISSGTWALGYAK